MSFDLMLFDKTAPKDEESFKKWFDKCCKWEENHEYHNYRICTSSMQTFFLDLIKTFPPISSELTPSADALEDDPTLEDRLTDYSIGYHFIYCTFPWSIAGLAYSTVIELAEKHKVGFFNPSNPNFELIDYNEYN